jgi:hypothetical protein
MKLPLIGFGFVILFEMCTTERPLEASQAVGLISLLVHQYPLKEVLRYDLDSSIIQVRLINDATGLDSLLFQKTESVAELKQQRMISLSHFQQDRYANTCIEDGQVFTLIFRNSDSTLRKVSFQNYYHNDLGQLVRLLNSQVGSVYKISYDKEVILRMVADCDK